MKKIFKSIVLVYLIILSIACKHKIDPNAESGSYEDFYDYVKVYPAQYIEGRANTNPAFVESGVFRKGRTVKLSSYCIAKVEVTYKLWKEVYDWAKFHSYEFNYAGSKGSNSTSTENEPVTGISWIDSVVWCNAYTEMKKGASDCVYRLSKNDPAILKNAKDSSKWNTVYFDRSKKGYRLPTEAEWEYSARWQGKNDTNAIGYGSVYLTKLGNASGAIDNSHNETVPVACYIRISADSKTERNKTERVGSKRKNALGLYDMSGNVWEFCFDKFEEKPAGGTYTDPVGSASTSLRVNRGGGWHCPHKLICVGSRRGNEPNATVDNNTWGFRLLWND